jgi:nucleoside-diphosphate-sugar epimerase
MLDVIIITGGSGFIGTNLIDSLNKDQYKIINVDKAPPINPKQEEYWVNVNLLDYNAFKKVLDDYQPKIVVHLAARTDTISDKLEDYIDNTLGTENVVKAIEKSPSVKHVLITSTQYVYKSKSMPLQVNDYDYMPHTVYGQSKVITEEHIRNSDMTAAWTIIRPSNIWGPWHMRYPNELWKLLDKGWYVHPSKKEVIRTYGYVKNIVHQIIAIIDAPIDSVDKQTYVLGDIPIDSYIWLNAFSQRLRKKNIKRIPSVFFKGLSIVGDVLIKAKIPFPIYSTRYYNMVEDYLAATNLTISRFGLSHPDIDKNVDETINWVENEGKNYFEYWKNK